jgi:uncharacterized protein (TIGR00266 family)
MQVRITGSPSYAWATLSLSYDETAYIERGAIAALSMGVDVRGSFGGEGLTNALKRRVLGGESLLFTEVTAQVEGAWVAAAPRYPGDVCSVAITQEDPLLIDAGSLLAYSAGVAGDVRYSGVKTALLHEGVTMIEMSGDGLAIIAAYGAIVDVTLAPDEPIIVDTGHLMGFSASVTFDVAPLGSFSKAILTGEGLVARLTGPGRVYLQTRAVTDIRSWLFPDQYPQDHAPH